MYQSAFLVAEVFEPVVCAPVDLTDPRVPTLDGRSR
jgi:hypothetical protein